MNPPMAENRRLHFSLNNMRRILCSRGLIILCGVLLLMVSCGKKGPPVPPKSKIPPSVQNINYNVQGTTLRLYWPVVADGSDRRNVVSFRVYRSVRLATAARCPGCPMPFELAGEVLASNASEEGVMEFVDQLSPGNHYYYKIVPVSKDGVAGDASQVIKIEP